MPSVAPLPPNFDVLHKCCIVEDIPACLIHICFHSVCCNAHQFTNGTRACTGSWHAKCKRGSMVGGPAAGGMPTKRSFKPGCPLHPHPIPHCCKLVQRSQCSQNPVLLAWDCTPRTPPSTQLAVLCVTLSALIAAKLYRGPLCRVRRSATMWHCRMAREFGFGRALLT